MGCAGHSMLAVAPTPCGSAAASVGHDDVAEVGVLRCTAQHAQRAGCDDTSVATVNDAPRRGINRIVKRALDVVTASLALLVLAVPLAIIAVIVKLTSRGPVFYRQVRMSLDGKPFTIVKFRSMYHDAERDTGPVWAQPNDPRVTGFGHFLRRSNLDELPQLWNVLRGDMSVVGPRPERPCFADQFAHRIPHYILRHTVSAGLTGWAQVNGWRGNTPIETRIEYDLYYIEHWSLGLDLKIMWLTAVKGFFHKHAY